MYTTSEVRVYTKVDATSKLGVREYTRLEEIDLVFMYRVGPGPYRGSDFACVFS